jgi:S-formylglutathione hydrolase
MVVSSLETRPLETTLVPSPVEVAILAPDDLTDEAPLLLWLHGGSGDSTFLETCRPVFESAWKSGALPPMRVITPSAARSGYLDLPGGASWESFILDELLGRAGWSFGCSDDPNLTFVGGISMGGLGSLRLSFKHPDRFGAALALEPAIEEAVRWSEVCVRDVLHRPPELLDEWYGSPPDQASWEANSPSALMIERAAEIVASGLGIYIEVGDEDALHLDRGTELLHRLMLERAVPHEYRLVRGANHIGPSLPGRIADALGFLGRHVAGSAVTPELDGLALVVRSMEDERGYRRSQPVEVDGGIIDVRIHGDGPMIVMLPSLGRGADDFDDLGAGLAARGYTAVMPEPRGIGSTTAPLDNLTMALLAADVAAVIRAVGGDGASAHVLGHAFGNRVARMTATEYPELVESVILLACGGAVPPLPDDAAALRSVFDLDLDAEAHLAAVDRAFFADGNDASAWVDGWHPLVALSQGLAGESLDVAHWWEAGKAPVFIVQPADDVIAIAANALDIVQRLGDRARLLTIPNAGHALLPEQPAATLTAILGWLHRYGA